MKNYGIRCMMKKASKKDKHYCDLGEICNLEIQQWRDPALFRINTKRHGKKGTKITKFGPHTNFAGIFFGRI
jgi:hypothetical protein